MMKTHMMEQALALLQEQHRQEIERAIDNAARNAWDKWFRKEWYKAGARRRWGQERRQRWRLTRGQGTQQPRRMSELHTQR